MPISFSPPVNKVGPSSSSLPRVPLHSPQSPFASPSPQRQQRSGSVPTIVPSSPQRRLPNLPPSSTGASSLPPPPPVSLSIDEWEPLPADPRKSVAAIRGSLQRKLSLGRTNPEAMEQLEQRCRVLRSEKRKERLSAERSRSPSTTTTHLGSGGGVSHAAFVRHRKRSQDERWYQSVVSKYGENVDKKDSAATDDATRRSKQWLKVLMMGRYASNVLQRSRIDFSHRRKSLLDEALAEGRLSDGPVADGIEGLAADNKGDASSALAELTNQRWRLLRHAVFFNGYLRWIRRRNTVDAIRYLLLNVQRNFKVRRSVSLFFKRILLAQRLAKSFILRCRWRRHLLEAAFDSVEQKYRTQLHQALIAHKVLPPEPGSPTKADPTTTTTVADAEVSYDTVGRTADRSAAEDAKFAMSLNMGVSMMFHHQHTLQEALEIMPNVPSRASLEDYAVWRPLAHQRRQSRLQEAIMMEGGGTTFSPLTLVMNDPHMDSPREAAATTTSATTTGTSSPIGLSQVHSTLRGLVNGTLPVEKRSALMSRFVRFIKTSNRIALEEHGLREQQHLAALRQAQSARARGHLAELPAPLGPCFYRVLVPLTIMGVFIKTEVDEQVLRGISSEQRTALRLTYAMFPKRSGDVSGYRREEQYVLSVGAELHAVSERRRALTKAVPPVSFPSMSRAETLRGR